MIDFCTHCMIMTKIFFLLFPIIGIIITCTAVIGPKKSGGKFLFNSLLVLYMLSVA